MKVSIQGIRGSFHHMVANQYFDSFELNECSTFESLVKSIVNKESDYGIMAIENSIAGSILPNYALIDEYNLSITGCLLYTSPSPRDATLSRMPSSA